MLDPQRAAALRALGYQAYRQGNYPRARQHFERALALFGGDGADAATAHSDLGAAHAALGDHAAALRHHQAALQWRRTAGAATDLAATLQNLGATQRQLGALAEAEASHTEALALWTQALGHDHPMVARALGSLAALRSQAGDFAAAELHWRQALSVLRQAHGPNHPALAPTLHNLGVACRMQQRLEDAAAAFAAALAARPDLIAAQHNLAAALSRLGRTAEAARHRDQALARENVFVQPAPDPTAPRVLILANADTGNVPLEHIIPEQSYTRIWWFAAHGAARKSTPLPPYDIVFNGIGDADLTGPTEAVIAAFLRGCTKPVLNQPCRIAPTRRDLLARTLAGIEGCIIPETIRLPPGHAIQQAHAAGLHPPFLLRPIGAHGGKGVIRVNAAAEAPPPPADYYATNFIDCRGPDGYVRKYRVIYVDRVPYPYHLAISQDWMVHYFSAGMEQHDWKRCEEAAFLADWTAAVGPLAARAITAIGQRLDLDYCGVDFAVSPDGRAVIFEANATMLVHPEEPGGRLAFKNSCVATIIAGVARLLGEPPAAGAPPHDPASAGRWTPKIC